MNYEVSITNNELRNCDNKVINNYSFVQTPDFRVQTSGSGLKTPDSGFKTPDSEV